MADVFRFREFEWDRDGYDALKSSSQVRALLSSAANAIAARATAAGCLCHADVEQSKLHRRPYAVVATSGDRSVRHNADHNTILKSVDAGRLR